MHIQCLQNLQKTEVKKQYIKQRRSVIYFFKVFTLIGVL